LLAKQEEFKADGLPFEVDIGHHYTDEKNMDDIRTNGLMTKEDRLNIKVHVATLKGLYLVTGYTQRTILPQS